MLDDLAAEAVLVQILTSDVVLMKGDGVIERMLAEFFVEAVTGSLMMVPIGAIDESDDFLLDAMLMVTPRFDT